MVWVQGEAVRQGTQYQREESEAWERPEAKASQKGASVQAGSERAQYRVWAAQEAAAP